MSGLIVHEWLEKTGGAEQVVDAMCEVFPEAELFALWNDAPQRYRNVHESWIARTPLRHHKALALPYQPWTWRHIAPRRDDIEWVLVSSHLFAHHVDVRTHSGEPVPKFVYAHTPARYIWEPDLDKRGRSLAARTASSVLKPLDRSRAQEPVAIATNSEFVRKRICDDWQRDATVIYPPVAVERIQSVSDWRTRVDENESQILDSLPNEFILGASRFVPYKRLDWVIRVGESVGVPVVIAGDGPELTRLQAIASQVRVPVHFVIRPSTPMLYSLYQAASVFVFPAIEDFGIMPVEAQATGTPVVTTSIGGAIESHLEGVTGISSDRDDEASLASAVELAFDLQDRAAMRKDANRFGVKVFRSRLKHWMSLSVVGQ